MRAVRRCVVALSLLAILASSSAVAAPRDDDHRGRQAEKATKDVEKSKLPAFIRRVLDYLDSKLTVPPI